MKSKKDAIKIVEILKEFYPDAVCSLDFETPFQMLISVMLAAQCTDERVNKTTPNIFSKYSTPEDFANIDILELEALIHPCGFYKNKAKKVFTKGKIRGIIHLFAVSELLAYACLGAPLPVTRA